MFRACRWSVAIAALLLVRPEARADAISEARHATMADIAKVWVGGRGGLDYPFVRLECNERGEGLFVMKVAPREEAVAYALTRGNLKGRSIAFEVDALDAAAEPVGLVGITTPSSMTIVVLPKAGGWKVEVQLVPLATLESAWSALNARAEGEKRKQRPDTRTAPNP